MPLPLFKKRSSHIKNVIAIAAGKGGVGKSFVAATLARALKKQGLKVGLLDADLYGPSLSKMVPEEKGPEREGDKLIPALAEGMPLLSMGHFRKESEGVHIRAPLAAQLIKQFIKESEWGDLDYLLIDFPPGTGDIAIELAQTAVIEGVILVTTPQEMALIDVRRAADLFKNTGTPLIGIVENMSYLIEPSTHNKIEIFGRGGGKNLSSELKVPLLTEIPLVPEAGRLSDLGLSIYLSKTPELDSIKHSFEQIATHLLEWKGTKKIKSISLSGPSAFQIEWEEGLRQEFDLKILLSRCPCAACMGNKVIEHEVKAKGIIEVGRYALRIDFEKGCKNGIYPYNYLQSLGRQL